MLRVIRFGIILMVVFGLMWLLQTLGLDQGTAIMLISIVSVVLALLIARILKNRLHEP
jgi:membrane protein implicated in regulation of membrane protease activity